MLSRIDHVVVPRGAVSSLFESNARCIEATVRVDRINDLMYNAVQESVSHLAAQVAFLLKPELMRIVNEVITNKEVMMPILLKAIDEAVREQTIDLLGAIVADAKAKLT